VRDTTSFFVRSGWDAELDRALRKDNSELRIVCPFIKKSAAARLLDRGKPKKLLVITRASLADFYTLVSDIEALRYLIKNGAQIRVVHNLHTKLYIFGISRVVLTSANLTEKALRVNHEFGFVSESREAIKDCKLYFDEMWKGAGQNITESKLLRWAREVAKHKAKAGGPSRVKLPDYGTEIKQFSEPAEPELIQANGRAFVKFFGEGHRRVDRSTPVFDEVKSSGSNWALTYPRRKRPRNVTDGALMFMARFVDQPGDVLIYGRAIGMRHRPGIDEATPADIQKRKWWRKWSNYVTVHNPEFVNGVLSDGISLHELMEALGSNSFASTQRNAMRGRGNMDPRQAFRQHASVELSKQGAAWLTKRLEQAFEQLGKIGQDELNKLQWLKAE
jgi:HKD family nuclease